MSFRESRIAPVVGVAWLVVQAMGASACAPLASDNRNDGSPDSGHASSPVPPVGTGTEPSPPMDDDAGWDGGVALARPNAAAYAIALTSDALYVATGYLYYGGHVAISAMAKDGGALTPIAFGASNPYVGYLPSALALDATSAYWTFGDSVMKAPLDSDGGAATTLATVGDQTNAIALDAENVYFTSQTALFSVPIGGGDVQTLASFTSTDEFPGQGLAVDSTSVYFSDGDDIKAVPLNAGADAGASTLVSGQAAAGAMAIDATNVYWATSASAAQPNLLTGIGVAPLQGGTATALLPQSTPFAVLRLRLTATTIYWTDGMHVSAAPKAGGAVRQVGSLTSDLAANYTITDLAVDDANAYWTCAGNNAEGPGFVMVHPL